MESSDMVMLRGYSRVLWTPGATRRCPFGTLIQAVSQEANVKSLLLTKKPPFNIVRHLESKSLQALS